MKAAQKEITAKSKQYAAFLDYYKDLEPYINEELAENPDLYQDYNGNYLQHISASGEFDQSETAQLIAAADRRRLDSLPGKARKIEGLLPYLTSAIKQAAKDPEPIITTLYEVVEECFNSEGRPKRKSKHKKIITQAISAARREQRARKAASLQRPRFYIRFTKQRSIKLDSRKRPPNACQ